MARLASFAMKVNNGDYCGGKLWNKNQFSIVGFFFETGEILSGMYIKT
jgi:hypothetical protein